MNRNISASTFVETISDIFGSEAKEEFVEEIYYLILKDPSTTPDWSMIFGYSLDKAGVSKSTSVLISKYRTTGILDPKRKILAPTRLYLKKE